jgi:hypothetical protein
MQKPVNAEDAIVSLPLVLIYTTYYMGEQTTQQQLQLALKPRACAV